MELRDPVSSVSHFLTAVWALYATFILLRLTPPVPGRRFVVAVYGVSMVYLYTASGVYHGVPFTQDSDPEWFVFFQKLDKTGIYGLIAGTNTPIIAIVLAGAWRRWCLWGMWSLAAVGAACMWVFPKPPHEVTVVTFWLMGVLGLLPVRQYSRALGRWAIYWAFVGGFFYSAGAVCELLKWPVIDNLPVRVGPHEVFHVLTSFGTMGFFVMVAKYVVRYRSPGDRERPAIHQKKSAHPNRVSVNPLDYIPNSNDSAFVSRK